MFRNQYHFFVFVLSFVFLSFKVHAQPTLPDLAIVHQDGINILTWNCQYDGVKSIIVQRSSDSNFNYTTIGFVRNIKKGTQYYLDGHALPGVNWYRIKLVFGSDLVWTSNRIKIKIDSSQLAKARVLPPNDSLQALVSRLRTKTITVTDSNSGQANNRTIIFSQPDVEIKKEQSGGRIADKNADTTNTAASETKTNALSISIEVPDIESVNAYSYIKSQYVFTNPFTGHVNIEIADAVTAKYSIDFYDSKNNKIIQIPHISQPNLILDKRNFQHVGLFKFDLYKDKVKLETGYITIY